MPQLILASSSPQRRAILAQLGIEFELVEPDVDELTEGSPEELVVENAYRKAAVVAAGCASGGTRSSSGATVVLGVDTIVSLGSRVYGKPVAVDQARAMLEDLSGRSHQVLSGICVLSREGTRTGAAVTTVTFRELDARTIDWYLASNEWQGRAGGYAIQGRGAAMVDRIDGDYLNVVGLPVATFLDLYPSALFPAIS